jgi:UDP-GlcNAc3NAcA epimerase
MFDASLFYRDMAHQRSRVLSDLGLSEGRYVLATCHRAENADAPSRLLGIIDALIIIARDMPVILPLHPRTRGLLSQYGAEDKLSMLRVIEPVPFLDMIRLEQSAYAIITDSGGVQKEAYFYGVPCLTTRDETEWIETVGSGWNKLVGADTARIINNYSLLKKPLLHPKLYGDGDASQLIVSIILLGQNVLTHKLSHDETYNDISV